MILCSSECYSANVSIDITAKLGQIDILCKSIAFRNIRRGRAPLSTPAIECHLLRRLWFFEAEFVQERFPVHMKRFREHREGNVDRRRDHSLEHLVRFSNVDDVCVLSVILRAQQERQNPSQGRFNPQLKDFLF